MEQAIEISATWGVVDLFLKKTPLLRTKLTETKTQESLLIKSMHLLCL